MVFANQICHSTCNGYTKTNSSTFHHKILVIFNDSILSHFVITIFFITIQQKHSSDFFYWLHYEGIDLEGISKMGSNLPAIQNQPHVRCESLILVIYSSRGDQL